MPTSTQPSKVSKQPEYVWAVGRRKQAIARVRLYSKRVDKSAPVDIMVNDKPVGQYFSNPASRLIYARPLELTDTLSRFHISVKLQGSGLQSQLDAMLNGISRALVKVDPANKPILKKAGYITRDPRERQKRMIGQGGRARAKKQSPKR